nr:MarC family protein [Piscirickettsia litoralis]
MLLGLSMLNMKSEHKPHTQKEHEEAEEKPAIAVVPLAIPIIAGPGALAAVIIHSQSAHSSFAKLSYLGVDIAIAIIITLILLFAPFFHKILGVAGLKIVERIMGLILMAMAVTMMAAGAHSLFPAA